MSAIVGAAGLAPTLAAVRRGAMVALANKECLVCAGPLFSRRRRRSGARLLPVDSEHNAIFQVLTHPERVERMTLTASGGPFRTWTREAWPARRLSRRARIPNWSMGAKISVDSATLMNKGLELIEAAYLFGMPRRPDRRADPPQTIVHSLVHYADGSVLAQMGAPDMRMPIAYALAWPDRAAVSAARLDLAALGQLTLRRPTRRVSRRLALARAALEPAPAARGAQRGERDGGGGVPGRAEWLPRHLPHGRGSSGCAGGDRGRAIAKTPSSFDEVAAVDGAARRAARRIARRLAAA